MKNPVLDPRYDLPGSLSDQERLARAVAQSAVEAMISDIREKGPLLKRPNPFGLRLETTLATVVGFACGFAACGLFWR